MLVISLPRLLSYLRYAHNNAMSTVIVMVGKKTFMRIYIYSIYVGVGRGKWLFRTHHWKYRSQIYCVFEVGTTRISYTELCASNDVFEVRWSQQ